jgi:rhodanese-related sulfurtransferase
MSLWSKLTGKKPDKETDHTTDPLPLIRERLASGEAVMLDVRSQSEHDERHLRDVIFIPITRLKSLPDDTRELPQLDRNKIIYCHCKAGGRASTAAQILRPMGYDVRSLPQSCEKLIEEGFEPA